MPTRYLKPGICDSDSINALSPMAEVLFYRLLVNVDDFGRFDARPILVKSKCFPIREDVTSKQVEDLLVELAANGLLILYQHGGKAYLQMQKWDNQPRSKESKFPQFDDTCTRLHTTVCNPRTLLPGTGTGTGTGTENRNRKPEPRTGTGVQGGKAKPQAEPFILPDWIDRQKWDLWIKTRKGKKMIAEQMQAQVDKLNRWRQAGLDHAKALADAAAAGWQGLHEPSRPGAQGQFLTAQQQRDENNRRSTEEFLNDSRTVFGGSTIDGEYSNA